MQIVEADLMKRVYAKIKRFGEQVDLSNHFLSGVYAYKSDDGFVITLSDTNNSISLNFEHQLHCQLACNQKTQRFLKKMKSIDRRYP